MYISDQLGQRARETPFPPTARQEQRVTGRHTFRAREQIANSVGAGAGAHIVLSGMLSRYTLTPDGRRQFTALLLPGDVIGFESVLNLKCADSTIALTDSVCKPLTSTDLAESDTWMQVWDAIERQTLAASDWTLNIGTRPALQRLAYFFHDTLTRMRALGVVGAGTRCQLPLTQMELADFLALTPVHINRCLSVLRCNGIATFRSGSLYVPNLQELWRVAQFEAEMPL
ncbi:MAG: Crp/Fnr family transcriptional regulator [Proteobacteria bacterium]|nr:Crp/Fnr family transcriptional regulator [Pseudomonadota bacterium]